MKPITQKNIYTLKKSKHKAYNCVYFKYACKFFIFLYSYKQAILSTIANNNINITITI
jgi:hypothetical protein